MTAEERHLVPFEPIDYGDLASVVQQLRMIGWRASLGPARISFLDHPCPWFEDVGAFDGYLAPLRLRAGGADAKVRHECAILIQEAERVFAALRSGLPKPDADDIVARYVAGEIGDRTARYVMNWDSWQLIEECAKRGLPPMQMTQDDGGAEVFADILKGKGNDQS